MLPAGFPSPLFVLGVVWGAVFPDELFPIALAVAFDSTVMAATAGPRWSS